MVDTEWRPLSLFRELAPPSISTCLASCSPQSSLSSCPKWRIHRPTPTTVFGWCWKRNWDRRAAQCRGSSRCADGPLLPLWPCTTDYSHWMRSLCLTKHNRPRSHPQRRPISHPSSIHMLVMLSQWEIEMRSLPLLLAIWRDQLALESPGRSSNARMSEI